MTYRGGSDDWTLRLQRYQAVVWTVMIRPGELALIGAGIWAYTLWLVERGARAAGTPGVGTTEALYATAALLAALAWVLFWRAYVVRHERRVIAAQGRRRA